ncbi:MAG: hypothetical protein HY925_16200 [Elusimicrobia bacterium]|nr:hypothetical protein [Elusimicrobiota bacterium]
MSRALLLAALLSGCGSAAKKGPEPPPVGLIVELKLPPDARMVGGLSGPLRIEPWETMTHAVERGASSSPVTFGYDPSKPALIVENESLPGGRAVFPVKPPYPQTHKVALGGAQCDLVVKPAKP